MANEWKLDIPNDINVVVSNKENGVLLDEQCCTLINIVLKNDGKIGTSFLGSHNPFIVMQLERATKYYFKELKKKLKQDYKEYANVPEFDDVEECDCGHEHHEHECGCGEHHHEDEHNSCDCGDPECKCEEQDCDCVKTSPDHKCHCAENNDDKKCHCGDTDDFEVIEKSSVEFINDDKPVEKKVETGKGKVEQKNSKVETIKSRNKK